MQLLDDALASKAGHDDLPPSNSTAQPTSHLRFSRAQRLSRASDIEFVKRTGKRVKSGRLDVRITASPSLCPRVGVIVPKYGHSIVERNKLRRRIREIVRVHMLPVLLGAPPADVLLRALPRAYSATFEVLKLEIDGIITRMS